MSRQTELDEVTDKIERLKSSLEGIIPIWNQVDRKVKALKMQIDHLEQKKIDLMEGQSEFDFGNIDF